MHVVTTSVHFRSIAEGLRAPVDITLPYGAHMSLRRAGKAAAERRDFGTRVERARDRSIYPACGSGVSFAGVGVRRERVEGSETS